MMIDIGTLSCEETVPDMVIWSPSEYDDLSVVTVIDDEGFGVCPNTGTADPMKSDTSKTKLMGLILNS